ncbi:MAG: hypothetical protein WEB06_18345, partial [Actinomycetota bacterium]
MATPNGLPHKLADGRIDSSGGRKPPLMKGSKVLEVSEVRNHPHRLTRERIIHEAFDEVTLRCVDASLPKVAVDRRLTETRTSRYMNSCSDESEATTGARRPARA